MQTPFFHSSVIHSRTKHPGRGEEEVLRNTPGGRKRSGEDRKTDRYLHMENQRSTGFHMRLALCICSAVGRR